MERGGSESHLKQHSQVIKCELERKVNKQYVNKGGALCTVHWFTVHNNVQLEEQTLPLFLLRTSHHRQQLELVREKLVVEHSLFAQLSALCLTSL